MGLENEWMELKKPTISISFCKLREMFLKGLLSIEDYIKLQSFRREKVIVSFTMHQQKLNVPSLCAIFFDV